MDFTLDKKHEMARSLFKEFAETEVKPLAQETDETEAFPAETVKKMQSQKKRMTVCHRCYIPISIQTVQMDMQTVQMAAFR